MSYFYNCGRYLIRDHSGDSFGLCVLLGIDTSARLISLAINIALMGYILIEGILSSLRSTFSRSLDAPQLRSLAERIAAGDVVSPQARVSGTSLSGFVKDARSCGARAWIWSRDGVRLYRRLGAGRGQFRDVRSEGAGAPDQPGGLMAG